MKDNILEIKVTTVNKEYSVVDIIMFNNEIEYEEEDIVLREYDNFPQYRPKEKVLYINDKDLKKPFPIKDEFLKSLYDKVDEINKKYGIERFPIKRLNGSITFYYLNELLNVDYSFESNAYPDIDADKAYKIYNYFENKEEAEYCAEKMKKYLLELRKEWRKKDEKNTI